MIKYSYSYNINNEIIILRLAKPIHEVKPWNLQGSFKKALIKKGIDVYEHILQLGFEVKICNICKKEHNPYLNLKFYVNEENVLKISDVWYGMVINGKINYDRYYCYGRNKECPGRFMNANSIEYVSATMNLSEKEARDFIHQNNKSPFYLENHESIDAYAKSQSRGSNFFIEKYGMEIGSKKFEEYESNHKYWTSKQYQIDRFGQKDGSAIWEEISKRKAITIANLQMRFGNDIGLAKFNEWKTKISPTNAKIIEKLGYEKGKAFIDAKNSKSLETRQVNSNNPIIPKSVRLEYLIYLNLVWDETHENLLKYSHAKFGSSFKKKNLSLDHQVSIKFGFMNGISPSIIGHIENLRYISKSENSKKRDTCNITIDELLHKIREHEENGK